MNLLKRLLAKLFGQSQAKPQPKPLICGGGAVAGAPTKVVSGPTIATAGGVKR